MLKLLVFFALVYLIGGPIMALVVAVVGAVLLLAWLGDY
jgi:uncharacterized membrane protein YeaQ/YmgE (transglycosylase-associated protein family)